MEKTKMTVPALNENAASSQAAESRKLSNLNSNRKQNFSKSFLKTTQAMSFEEFERACLKQMAEDGVPYNGPIHDDGRIHYYSKHGKRRDRDERYVCHKNMTADGKIYWVVTYMSWSGGFKKFPPFRSFDIDTNYNDQERSQLRAEEKKRQKEVEEKIKKEQDEKAKRAREDWENSTEKPETESQKGYLLRKKIQSHSIRYARNVEFGETDDVGKFISEKSDAVAIPLRNIKGEIRGIQYIREDGIKRIHGHCTGNFHLIGQINDKNHIFVVEGYATGASIHEASEDPVAVVFSCSNLLPAIGELRKKYPNHRFTIARDDDAQTELDRGKNPGKEHAEKAARQYGCKIVAPLFPEGWKLPNGKLPSDFNDVRVYFGLDALKIQIGDPWYKNKPVPFREAALQLDVSPFPEEFRRAILEEHRFIKSPIEAIAAMGIVVLSAAIGKSAIIEELPGLEHHVDMAFINVMEPGERKSDTFKEMAKELDQYERNRKNTHEEKVKVIRAKNTIIENEIKASRNKKESAESLEASLQRIADLELKKEQLPPTPRLYTTDTSEQRLFELMEERNGAFAVLSGEGRTIANNIMGRFNQAGEANDSIYLAALSGDKITRDRIGANGERIEKTIEEPCLSLGFFVQPDKWAQMASNKQLQESGFLARLFVVCPAPTIGYRLPKPGEHRGLKKEEVAPFHEKIRFILNQRDLSQEMGQAHKVLIIDEVAKARDDLFQEIEINSRPGRKYSETSLTAAIASKFTSRVCRIALILHIFKFPDVLKSETSFLNIDTWNEARAISEYYLNETLRALRLTEKTKHKQPQPTEEKLVFWLYDRLAEGKPTKSRDIQNQFRPKMTADAVEQIMKKLEQNNCARIDTKGNIELHPYILEHGTGWMKSAKHTESDADE